MQRRAEDYSVPRQADGGRAERQKGLSSAAVSAAFPPNFAKNHKKKTFSLLTGRWKHAIISSVRKVDPFGESRNLWSMTGCSAVW